MLTRVRRLLRRWFKKEQPAGASDGTSAQPKASPTAVPPPRRSPAQARPDAAPDGVAPVQEDTDTTPAPSPRDDAPSSSPTMPISLPPAAATSEEQDTVRDWTPPRLDTLAQETGISAPPSSPPSDEIPAVAVVDEDVLLTDYSDVTYPSVPGEYAQPPGVQPATKAQRKRRWASRRSPWRPAMTVELVRELEERRGSVSARLEGEPVEVSWPAQDDHGQSGFRVLEPDAAYFVAHGEAKGSPRTLDFALPDRTPAGEPATDDLDRLELVRLVAIAVEGLHRADVVTAGLGWSTFLFALGPRPAVVLHGPEHIRRLGGEFLAPTYPPAGDEASGVSPFDADRFRLAVLAYRLLVSHEPDGDIDPWNRRGVPGLSDSQVRRAWRLWERSTGPAGTRPQASEWMEALGV